MHFIHEAVDYPVCNSLYFDKTNDLNGYNLKVVLIRDKLFYVYDETKYGYERCSGYYKIICLILKEINATVTVKLAVAYGYVDSTPHGTFKDVLSHTADVLMNPILIRYYWQAQTYSFFVEEVKIVSLNLSITYVSKLLLLLDINEWFFCILSSVMAIVALKFILKKSITSALLDFMRLLVTAPISIKIQNFYRRLNFILLAIGIYSIYSFILSYLSAINILPDPESTIDSVEELIKRNFTVHGFPDLIGDISHKEVLHRYHSINHIDECLLDLFNDNQSVCLCPITIFGAFANKTKDIHISHGNLLERSYAYLLGMDSPFTVPFNKMLIKLNEGGLVNLMFIRVMSKYFDRENNKSNTAKPLEISRVINAFHVLFIGWALSILLFFIENWILKIKKICKRRVININCNLFRSNIVMKLK